MPTDNLPHFRDIYDKPMRSLRTPETSALDEDPYAKFFPGFSDDINEHFTPSFWNTPHEMAQLFKDQQSNTNNRRWAENTVNDEMVRRTREVTALYPHIEPGVVQGLIRANADDDMVREVSRLSAENSLRKGHFDNPAALPHLPYRSRKPRSPVRTPLAGDVFAEMQMQVAQKRREKRTKQAGNDAIRNPDLRGVLDDLRSTSLTDDRDRAEAVSRDPGIQYEQQRQTGVASVIEESQRASRAAAERARPPATSFSDSPTPNFMPQTGALTSPTAEESSRLGGQIISAMHGQRPTPESGGLTRPASSVRPGDIPEPAGEAEARQRLNRPREYVKSFLEQGHDRTPERYGGADSGGFFNDIGNFLRQTSRITMAMMDQGRRVLGGTIPQAIQTAMNQPNVSFTDALIDAEQGTGAYAVIPAILDRIEDGTLEKSDIESGNYLSTFLQLLQDPISIEEVDQYLRTEEGDNWFPAGDTDIEAWRVDREEARRFAENWYPDIVEAYDDDNDPYKVYASPGRIFARDRTPSSPGTRGYDLISGITDLGFTLLGDPVAYAAGGSSRVAQASRVFGRNITLGEVLWPRLSQTKNLPGIRKVGDKIREFGGYQGSRPLTIVEDATQQLTNSRHGQAVVDFATRNNNAREIWRGFGKKIDMATARELTKADNHADVRNILIRAAEGRSAETGEQLARRFRQLPGSGGQIVGPISRTFASVADGGGAGAGQALGLSSLIRHTGRTPRFFARAPMQGGINYGRNPNQGVENLERVMMNANLPKEQIDTRINEFIMSDSVIGRQEVINKAYGDISSHIAHIHKRPIRSGMTTEQIDEITQHNDAVDDFARRLSTAYGDEYQRMRAFFVDKDTGQPVSFPGAASTYNDPQAEEAQAVGGMISELLNDTMPLPDWRRMRRATDELGLSKLFDTARVDSTLRKRQEQTTKAMERVFVNLWQPLQLFRGAWMMRVSLEEVAGRFAANGLAGLSNHPGVYIGSALAGLPSIRPTNVTNARQALRAGAVGIRSRFGRYLDTPAARPFSEAESISFEEPLLEASNRRSGGGGWVWSMDETRNGGEGYIPIRTRNPQTGQLDDRGITAAALEMHRMANDYPMRKLAGAVNEDDLASIPNSTANNNTFDQIADLWWDGSLRDTRIAYARAHGKRKLSNMEKHLYKEKLSNGRDWVPESVEDALIHSRRFARDYLKQHHEARLLQDSVADSRLLRKIAGNEDISFHYKGTTQSIPLRQIRPYKGGKHRAAWKAWQDEIRNVYSEARSDAPMYVAGPKSLMEEGMGKLQETRLDDLVDGILRVTFTAPNDFLSRSPALRQFTWNATEELIPSMNKATRTQVIKNAKKARIPRAQVRRMQRLAEELDPGEALTSPKQVEMLALDQGVQDTKEMLYDVADRGQYADILRVSNPFLEAFREVYKHWGVALAHNPQFIPRTMQAYEAQRGVGRIYEDPMSGEDRFIYNGIGGIMEKLNVDPIHAEDPLDVSINATGRTQGLNLIAQSIFPSFGPAVTGPLGMMGAGDIDGQMGQFIRDVVFPFGEDESLEDAFMPAWMVNFWAWAKQDPEASAVWQSTRSNLTRALASTGEYTANEYGMITEGEARELQEDVDRMTSRLMFLRGAAQFMLPTGPDYQFEVRSPKDAAMYSVGEIAREFHEIAEEYDMDYDAATEEFVDRYGWDFLSTTMPATDTATSQAPSMDHLFWRQEHEDFVDTYPTVAMLLAPYADPDEWDMEAFYQSEIGPEGIRLEPNQQATVLNNILGTQSMKQEQRRIEKLADEQVSQGYLEDSERDNFVDIMKSELEGEIMKRYPGYKKGVAGTLADVEIDEEINQLRSALNDPKAPSNEVTEVLKEYFELRDGFVDYLNETQGLSKREDRGLLATKAGAPFRDELEIYLRRRQQEVPEIGAAMTNLLLPELDYLSPEDRTNRDAIVESNADLSRIRRETMYQLENLPEGADLPEHRMEDIDEELGPDAPARPDEVEESEAPSSTEPLDEPDTWNW